MQVYGQGSGLECRRHVQKLNLLQGEAEEALGWTSWYGVNLYLLIAFDVLQLMCILTLPVPVGQPERVTARFSALLRNLDPAGFGLTS